MCNDVRVLQKQFPHNTLGEETCKIQLFRSPGDKSLGVLNLRINVNLSSISNTSTSKLLCRTEV